MSSTRKQSLRWRRAARRLVAAVALAGLAISGASAARASVWPSSYERVARALQSTDSGERRAAAQQLAELPPEIGRPLARKALLDPDVAVRLSAARSAAVLGLVGAGDVVVPWLSDLDPRLRTAACELIEVSPTPLSVQALARVLGDADSAVRRAAAAAMGSNGSSEVVAPLLGHLDDTVVAVRLEVVRALGRLGDRRAVVPLVSKLQDPDAEVRNAAARALGSLGDARAVPTLLLALQDTSAGVRIQALDALGRLRAADGISAIAALLESPEGGGGSGIARSEPARVAALKALGRIGSPRAVQILIGELESEGGSLPANWFEQADLGRTGGAPVRRALVLAGEPAVAGLLAALGSTASPSLASGATLALGELGAQRALPEIVHGAQRGTVSLDAAFQALALLRDSRALPFVLEHLDDPDGRIRRMAVAVAARLLDPEDGDGRVVDPVRPRVTSLETPIVERIALIRLLGRSGAVRAQRQLTALAQTDHPAVKQAVVDALGELGRPAPAVDEVLLEALGAPAAELRLAAATALARVGGRHAARKLLHILGVSAEQDRGAIGIALSGALGRSSGEGLVADVRKALAVVPAPARDALIEGLGRMSDAAAGELLEKLAGGADVDDRRKVAEALAGHPARETALVRLLRDPDPAVRANALWSLGLVGSSRALPSIEPLLADSDVAVAGNAAVTLGRIAQRSSKRLAVIKPLCSALDDYRSYVRVNALVGLRVVRGICSSRRVRHLLIRDRSWRVRVAAADLLHVQIAASQDEDGAHRRALVRCAADDKDASVSRHCRHPRSIAAEADDLLVFVVPHAGVEPVARAPFALVRPDGALRLGVADRRGALFERRCPRGSVQLAVPAPLAP